MALLAIGSALTGSFSAARAASYNQFNLIGDSWKLVTMVTADNAASNPEGQTSYTIRFTDDGNVELTADCNNGGGTYALAGNTITLSPITTTLIGCSEGSIGSQFAAALTGEQTVSFNAGQLILTSGAGTVLTFKPAIVDVVWQWSPTVGGGATPTAVDPADYTLSLTGDGKLAVGADCNQGMGSFLTNGDAIAIRGIALTKAMCPAGSHGNEFVAQVQTATAYRVSGGQLTLTTNAGDMTFDAQPHRTSIAATPMS